MSEELARKFHETYERLAPSFGYTTRLGTRQFDPESDNGRLMIAVCDELLRHHAAALEELARLKAENSKIRSALEIVHFKRETWQ